jgi:hypothetical protein
MTPAARGAALQAIIFSTSPTAAAAPGIGAPVLLRNENLLLFIRAGLEWFSP